MVTFGTAAGGPGTKTQFIDQASAGVPGADESDDFNGDGYADLVVGAPNATISGKAKAGYVAVLYGSKSGVSPTNKKL
ncbi:FG-GAP repeat protein, partial [Streptomyces sp. SP18BB07]|uniref:FG-GAP repeat protein n=1 Tax=Streptomyces sp. SP18BB07 TaxID=3002522 RepID=UPI002E7A4280